MKRIMLSAASIMFIFTGAFARPTKAAASTTSSNAQMQQLSKEFPGLSSTIPSSVEITKHFQVTTESDEDIIPTGYEVILGGKHFDEKAYYNADGIMMSYKEELKNTELPGCCQKCNYAETFRCSNHKRQRIYKRHKRLNYKKV
jgi:hypothetical protein